MARPKGSKNSSRKLTVTGVTSRAIGNEIIVNVQRDTQTLLTAGCRELVIGLVERAMLCAARDVLVEHLNAK